MRAAGKILVVDDTPANLLAFRCVLRETDHDVVTAGSGFEALKLAQENAFALILLDMRMPGMDGLETARRLRALEGMHYTPILLMSAFEATPQLAAEVYLAGAVDFLLGPVDADTLRQRVRHFMELHRGS